MNRLVLPLALLGMLNTAFGQRRVQTWSLGGYGSVLFPGTGHAPSTPPGGVTGPYFFGSPSQWNEGPSAATQARGSENAGEVFVPCVDSECENSDPPVASDLNATVNKSTVSRGDVSDETPLQPNFASAPPSTSAAPRIDDGTPTIYLIAFKDHTVVQALGYWIEGRLLHYVSVEYAVNQASIVLIDISLSQRLNAERSVAFYLDATR